MTQSPENGPPPSIVGREQAPLAPTPRPEASQQSASRRVFQNSGYLVLNTLISAALGFVFWAALARLHTPESLGIVVALTSAAITISSFTRLGVDVAIVRFIARAGDPGMFLNTCLTLVAVITAVIAATFVLGVDLWASAIRQELRQFWSAALFILFTILLAWSVLLMNVFVAFRDAKYAFSFNMIVATGRIPVALALTPFAGAMGAFIGWGVSLVIGVALGIAVFTRKFIREFQPSFRLNSGVLREIKSFSAANYVMSSFGTAMAGVLPLIILNHMTSSDSAFFYVAFMIAAMLHMVPRAASQVALAEGAFDAAEFRQKLRFAAIFTSIIITTGVVFVMIVGDRLLALFGDDYAHASSDLLTVLALGTFPYAVAAMYSSYLRVQLRNLELVIFSVSTSIGLILLSDILLRFGGGIESVGYAFLITYCLATLYVAGRCATLSWASRPQ